MKLSIIDDNNFNIFVNNKYLDFNNESENDLYNSLKKVLINVRKRYGTNIYGFYEVDIYTIENIGTILKFNKKDDDDFIYKTVDLKIIGHNNDDVYLKFDDYYLISDYSNIKFFNNSYYIKADSIKKEDINKLIEFFEIVFDDRLIDISYI